VTHASAVVLVALALDLTFGEPSNRWHPVAWAGHALAWGRGRLARGSRLRLCVTGAVLVVALTGIAAALAWGFAVASSHLGILGVLLEGVALKATLSVRRLADAALAVAEQLEHGELVAARDTVGHHLVSRKTVDLDEGHVASAAIESVAENLTDSLVAPLAFFVAFGLPGAVAYRIVNTADAMLGYRDGVLEYFGKTAARLDDLLNLVPARLAAPLVGLAAVLGRGGIRQAFSTMWSDHSRTASPNAGWTMAAMAGALGVRLEKPGTYSLGQGELPAPADIRRAVRIFGGAVGLAGVLALTAATFR
jgi:adenosylcobinamide-phosphate synthase